MTFSDYSKHDGLGLAELVRKKKISPAELVEAAISQIETHNPKIKAVDHGSIGIIKPLAAQTYEYVPWTPVFNVTGQPAMSVPLYWNDAGLPIGMHFAGK